MNSQLDSGEELPVKNGVVAGDVVNEATRPIVGLKELIVELREKARNLNPLDLLVFVPYLSTPEVLLDKIGELFSMNMQPLIDYVKSFPDKFKDLDVQSVMNLIQELEGLGE